MDTKAIAFVTNIDGAWWQRIGYVVQEIVDEVHKAMDNGMLRMLCTVQQNFG